MQCNLQQRKPIAAAQYPVLGQDGLGVRLWRVKDRHCFGLGIPPQKSFAQGVLRTGCSYRYAAVGLFHQPCFKDFIHILQGGCIFGAQHQPAGVPVDSVA